MKISNKEVLKRASRERELIKTVQKWKLVYAGHMIKYDKRRRSPEAVT